MSTRSLIIAQLTHNLVGLIYCHSDGYLSGNGETLLTHYKDQAKIDQLIALGNLSHCRAEIGVKHEFNLPEYGSKEWEEYKFKYNNMCKAYERDRGDCDEKAYFCPNIKTALKEAIKLFAMIQYVYVWNGKQWLVGEPDCGLQAFIPVDTALELTKVA